MAHNTPLLEVRGLRVTVEDAEVLKGIDLTVNAGEVHAIMGPNGSGKSTLVNVMAGNPDYVVTAGVARLNGRDLLAMTPEDRARDGLFLAFQYPTELPGVRNWQFLKSAVDAIRKHRGEEEFSIRAFDKLYEEKLKLVEIDPELMRRSVNEGFSGGEKKRNEMLQMLLLNPALALLDETDSGLDIDALKVVADAVNQHRSSNNAVLMVTHYQRMLNYVMPDIVHVLFDGRIVRSGGQDLALELEDKGYEWIREEVAAGANS